MNDLADDIPATEPGLIEPPQTGWPKVIGIISIVFAVIGLACQVLGFLSAFFSEWGMKLAGMDVTMPPVIKITGAASAVVMTCLGFLMLAGGIGLVRRRRAGVSRLKTWALLRVVMIAVGVVTAVLTLPAQIDFQRNIQEATNEKLREGGRTDMIKPFDEDATWTKMVVTTGVMSAVFAVYPLFIVFYLSREKIRDEVGTWE